MMVAFWSPLEDNCLEVEVIRDKKIAYINCVPTAPMLFLTATYIQPEFMLPTNPACP